MSGVTCSLPASSGDLEPLTGRWNGSNALRDAHNYRFQYRGIIIYSCSGNLGECMLEYSRCSMQQLSQRMHSSLHKPFHAWTAIKTRPVTTGMHLCRCSCGTWDALGRACTAARS